MSADAEQRFPHEIQPNPDPETATAADWSLHHLLRAQAFNGLSWELTGTDQHREQMQAVGFLIHEYALSELYRHASDEVAREIALDLDAGDVIGERIWDRLTEHDIVPQSIRRFSTEAEDAAKRAAKAAEPQSGDRA